MTHPTATLLWPHGSSFSGPVCWSLLHVQVAPSNPSLAPPLWPRVLYLLPFRWGCCGQQGKQFLFNSWCPQYFESFRMVNAWRPQDVTITPNSDWGPTKLVLWSWHLVPICLSTVVSVLTTCFILNVEGHCSDMPSDIVEGYLMVHEDLIGPIEECLLEALVRSMANTWRVLTLSAAYKVKNQKTVKTVRGCVPSHSHNNNKMVSWGQMWRQSCMIKTLKEMISRYARN